MRKVLGESGRREMIGRARLGKEKDKEGRSERGRCKVIEM